MGFQEMEKIKKPFSNSQIIKKKKSADNNKNLGHKIAENAQSK